jgi:hypothetical protein
MFLGYYPEFRTGVRLAPWVKWGCALADFDNDGWPDCFFVNGQIDNNRRLLAQPVDYEEIPLLFRNDHGKRFRLATRDAGPYFDTGHVGRGAAFGDVDNDVDVDIVVNHKDAAPALLRNDTRSGHHWIRFALQGTKSNRDAIGARLEITTGERTTYRQRKGGLQHTGDQRFSRHCGLRRRRGGKKGCGSLALWRRPGTGEPQDWPGTHGYRTQEDLPVSGSGSRMSPRRSGRLLQTRPPCTLVELGDISQGGLTFR